MNRDLEKQLDEMGPEYRAVVARLKGAREAEGVRRKTSGGRPGFVAKAFRRDSYLTAASLLVLVGFGAFFLGRTDFGHATKDVSSAPREYRASVDEIIATQNPDGGWQSDFLTRRNAAVLKTCGEPAARIAYKRAMRNLRIRGVL